jgi:hypothetical protein
MRFFELLPQFLRLLPYKIDLKKILRLPHLYYTSLFKNVPLHYLDISKILFLFSSKKRFHYFIYQPWQKILNIIVITAHYREALSLRSIFLEESQKTKFVI